MNAVTSCAEGFVKNPSSPFCYKNFGTTECSTDKLKFKKDSDVQGFMNLVNEGKLNYEGIFFIIGAERNDVGDITFDHIFKLADFDNIEIIHDDPYHFCFKARVYNGKLRVRSFNCENPKQMNYICQDYNSEQVNCDDPNYNDEEFKVQNSLDLMLNPLLRESYERSVNLLTEEYKNRFKNVRFFVFSFPFYIYLMVIDF